MAFLLSGLFVSWTIFATAQGSPTSITLSADPASAGNPCVVHALNALYDELRGQPQCAGKVAFASSTAGHSILLSVVPCEFTKSGKLIPESYRIVSSTNGQVLIKGSDSQGVLWGARDFIHYYAKDWLDSLQQGKPWQIDCASSPTIQNRGLWSWWYGCNDPYAYVDRASEWKLNTIIFWNLGVPPDAEHLNSYAHERGVRIWWGFSWGWGAGDFRDASPELAKRLSDIFEEQKKRIGPDLGVLCPYDPKTPGALKEFVLDVFEKQYQWIPNLDGIYFQTATEATCPCAECKSRPRGEGYMLTMLPIIEEIHRRRPDLVISCGVHNSSDPGAYDALKHIPSYCNICWEAGTVWATDDLAKKQMALRGDGENYAGIYRITMDCGLVLRGGNIFQGKSDRSWLPKIEALWNYLEEGKPAWKRKGGGPFKIGTEVIGYPCSSDWTLQNGKMLENPNFKEMLKWARMTANGPARTKGIFPLVEAGLIDLKMRRVPAMVAETIWNPLASDAELERRCGMIWRKEVLGWHDPVNPYWNETVDYGSGGTGSGNDSDLGAMYKLIQRIDENEITRKARPLGKSISLKTADKAEIAISGGKKWQMSTDAGNLPVLVAPVSSILLFNKTVSDFDAAFDFAVPDNGRVAGLIFNYHDPRHFDLLNIYIDGDNVYWYRQDGSGFKGMKSAPVGPDILSDQWISTRVVKDKDQLKVIIEGKEVLAAPIDGSSSGQLGLRSEGSGAFYRNINIKTGSQEFELK